MTRDAIRRRRAERWCREWRFVNGAWVRPHPVGDRNPRCWHCAGKSDLEWQAWNKRFACGKCRTAIRSKNVLRVWVQANDDAALQAVALVLKGE